MADTAVAVTAGTGTNIDTRTEATNGNHRQVIVIGDPATNAGVAPVDVTTGLVVNIAPGVDKGSGTGGSLTQRVIMDSSQLDPVVAHDAVDSGAPYKQGFKASTSLAGLTLVANADRTDAFAGVDGVQIVRPHCNLEDIVSGNATNTDGASTQCIAAQAAGIKTYLTSIILCNTSATAITVDIKDGTTVKVSLPLPAGSGCIFNPPVPIPGTAATAWNFDGSAAATTVTCSMVGFKSKV